MPTVFEQLCGTEAAGDRPSSPPPAGTMVRSQIVKANGDPVHVDYMMRHKWRQLADLRHLPRWRQSARWAIRRSEFAAILKNEGIDGLIAALNRKADILTGTTARSF